MTRAADDYAAFVASKVRAAVACGFDPAGLAGPLFPHQHALAQWAVRRGRAAVFAGTGLGKTRIYLAFADAVARHTGGRVLVLTPLAVAPQGAAEAAVMGLDARVARDGSEVASPITITNYDRLHRFDPRAFSGVVLDESSCIKHHDAKTLRVLLDAFRDTPYRLACTATPAPNDWTELGTHAEFLGVCTRPEMLAEFFVHDGGSTQDWRLKGHAKAAFWRWVSSWAALVRSPADLGFDASGYDLPPLAVEQHTIASEQKPPPGFLFAMPAQSLSERRGARRGSIDARVAACAARVNAEAGEPWVVWCDLNDESEALVRAIPGAVEVRGSLDADEKERRLSDFSEGRTRVLVTKCSISGWGLNWQHCARTAFVGVTDSWEAYHQAVRRFWRFGQRRPVQVHVYASELEGAVVANLARKERDAQAMADALSAETLASVRAAVLGSRRDTNPYEPAAPLRVPAWLRTREEAA